MKTRFAFRTFLLLCLLCLWGGANCAFAQETTTVTDELTVSSLGVGSTYAEKTSSVFESGAQYKSFATTNSEDNVKSIQINKKSNYGLVAIKSGGKAKSVKVTFFKGTNTLNVYGSNTAYTATSELYDSSTSGILVGSLSATGSITIDGDYKYIGFISKKGAIYISSIEIVWEPSTEYQPEAPTINPSTQTFSKAFTAIITAEDGADIYYTTNGDTPTTESTKYESGVEIPAATTTLKAIAVKDGATSEVTTAIYTYEEPIDETLGTFENPLSVDQVKKYSSTLTNKTVWVKGKVVGCLTNGGTFQSTYSKSNFVIGESQDDFIPVETGSNTYISNNLDFDKNSDIKDKEVMLYGKVKTYFLQTGLKSVSFYTFGETISVNTEEGYSTYYYASAPTLMPTGVNGGTVTISNDKMTIDYKYNGNETLEGGDLVPAATPVLIKADKKGTYPLIYSASNKGNSAGTQNLVGQETTGTITAEDGYYYYKLAYDDYTAKTDLGFYWGAEDGGVFSVPAGKAYLKVAQTADKAVTAFRFDGTTVTGIGNVAMDGAAQQVKSAYTIDGRRVDANRLTKGIYIVNGKKVVVK